MVKSMGATSVIIKAMDKDPGNWAFREGVWVHFPTGIVVGRMYMGRYGKEGWNGRVPFQTNSRWEFWRLQRAVARLEEDRARAVLASQGKLRLVSPSGDPVSG